MITTTAIIATEEQAEATMQAVREGAARRKAEKAAKAARATTRAPRKTTLELARAQFDRQLAERPTGIHRNPDAKAGRQWEAYRDGRLLGGADSNFGAQAILDGVTYDELSRRNAQGMDAPAGDVVVTAVIETPAGDVVVREVVLAEAGVCPECDGRGRIIDPLNEGFGDTMVCPKCHPENYIVIVPALDQPATTEEATMDAQTYEREVIAVEQAGTGEYAAPTEIYCQDCGDLLRAGAEHEVTHRQDEDACTLCDGVGGSYEEDGWHPCHHGAAMVHAGDLCERYGCDDPAMVARAGLVYCRAHDPANVPQPLPICDCGATYTTHAIPGCECAAEAAYTGVTLEAALANAKPPLPKCAKIGCIEGATVTCAYCGAVYCADCATGGCHECEERGMLPLLDETETPPPAPSASEPASGCDNCEGIDSESCVYCTAGCPWDARGELCPEEYRPFCNDCKDGVPPLPFTPGPADAADALAEIEAAAGVVDVEPPPDEMTLQFAAVHDRFLVWCEAVTEGRDVAEARAAMLGDMLRVEQLGRLVQVSAVVGRAA